jgi:OTT_1508-like deaminase
MMRMRKFSLIHYRQLLHLLGEIPTLSQKSKVSSTLSLAKLDTLTVLDISMLSWIVGQSSVLKSILHMTRSAAIAKLLSSLRKFGQYYRGCQLLHDAIMKSNLNRRYQALLVRQVPSPASENHTMNREWYKVVEIIYHRTRHRCMVLSPGQFVEPYPSINDYHNEWPMHTFVRHAEVCLIDHLMQVGRRPTEIGVSKLCCRACYVWINGVNEDLRKKGATDIWAVSGTHGKNYPWQRDMSSRRVEGERNVLRDLYDQLAEKFDQARGSRADSDSDSEFHIILFFKSICFLDISHRMFYFN